MSINQTFDFDLPVAGALHSAIVITKRYGLKQVPLLLMLQNLLADPEGLTEEIFELANIDHARVLDVVQKELGKRYPEIVDYEIRPEEEELVGDHDLEPLLLTVLVNAAIHAYTCGRKVKAADTHDILVCAINNIELNDPELCLRLGAAGLTSLVMKICDRQVHGEGGLMESHDVEAVPVLDAEAEGFDVDPFQLPLSDVEVEEDDELNPYPSEKGTGTPKDIDAVDEEELRKILHSRLKALEEGPFGEMLKKLANEAGSIGVLQAQPSSSCGTCGNCGSPLGAGEETEENVTRNGKSRKLTAEERKLLGFTRDLTAAAARGDIDVLIGRETEMERIFEILCCRRKNKPLVIGESGTGKTALIEGLALRIEKGDVPPFLQGKRIYALNAGTLVSRYRGMFSSQLEQIAKILKNMPDAILFIDDIHVLVDGNGEGGAEQINALQRLISDDQLRIIASTRFKPWRSTLSNNEAIARRFQPVELASVSEEDAKAILHGLAPQYEAYHRVHFAEGVVDAVVSLSNRYIVDRPLPDKAVSVLDELAAHARMNRAGDDVIEVTADGLPKIISRIARVPADQVGHDENDQLAKLDSTLKGVVFGQDPAIDSLVSAIRVSRSGLGNLERPVGSFLFTGPTGVGKTEVARQLASALGVELLRFDMSEYSESHTVSRLIGSPVGYVGHEEGGLLTEAVTKNPYCVILFDELEKAHPQLFNLLLQVMDNGKLTDSSGRTADFHNAIIIMTSNVGARIHDRQTIGFGEGSAGAGDDMKEIKRVFTPEFRNRLDAIVSFQPLSRDTLMSVVDKFLGELSEQLARKSVVPSYSEALKNWLCEKGYDPHMGARPMRRLIAEEIRRPLANELLFGALTEGGNVTIDYVDGRVNIKTTE